jgi:leucyl/phenylalanyl-tRNA---protein transferase
MPVLPVDSVPPERAARRDVLFRETLFERCERIVLGIAWALKNHSLGLLPYFLLLTTDILVPRAELPDPEATLDDEGLVGIVHDLSLPTLLAAYRNGLGPAGHFGRLSWMSLSKRCVLFFNEFHIAKRLRRLMRQGLYTVTFDQDFEGVIKACSERRAGRWHVTWITPRIMRAYTALHDAGHAHSFEVWNKEGQLVGGGYGVAMGDVFYTESQFSRESNTSKLGFTVFNWHLAKWGFAICDGKVETPTIKEMGFRDISRMEFLTHTRAEGPEAVRPSRWIVEKHVAEIADWQPQEFHAADFSTLQPALVETPRVKENIRTE